ncbi:hypothetical protein DEU56DRAFT_829436 [Suillus clintonianus]|uniref:uncharacterized protein n=1 Tax=Suillus clintonianus TaxID=1904413 RepID=UPI001B86A337|nr:uncharacterized protein DEU56DRAFT_829436 [Suillus clintonianus]KAG2123456.1 hypothetical protein DEU56DRAFT_829436 [Suillus clintonianus]
MPSSWVLHTIAFSFVYVAILKLQVVKITESPCYVCTHMLLCSTVVLFSLSQCFVHSRFKKNNSLLNDTV